MIPTIPPHTRGACKLPHITSVFLLLLSFFHCFADAVDFTDVTASAGLSQPNGKQLKYGGAMLADVNGDGWLDILLLFHYTAPAEFYFSNGGMNYTRAPWSVSGDVHGSTAYRYSPYRKGMSMVVQRGGGWGYALRAPHLFNIDAKTNQILTASPGFPIATGARGRSACAMQLHKQSIPRPDLILTSAHLLDNKPHQRGVELKAGGRAILRTIKGGFPSARNEFVNIIDIDSDGQVELVVFQDLHVYKLVGDFWLRDVTTAVLPRERQFKNQVNPYFTWRGVIAMTEFDFNNDGKWDMYLARTTQQNLHWLPKRMVTDDILLMNIGGQFKDVSVSAGISPFMNGYSRGVTAGDFDNDGWVDLIVARYIGPDLFLRNRGDGTFYPPVDAGFRRANGIPGDMVTAADLDEDGRLDVVVSEGSWYDAAGSWGSEKGRGYYRIMKNITPNVGNYILVRVRNSPKRRVTSLHAVVTLKFRYDRSVIMSRRVGNPGVAVSVSNIETVHFGVGGRTSVWRVNIRWTNGETEVLRNLTVNRKYTVGHQ